MNARLALAVLLLAATAFTSPAARGDTGTVVGSAAVAIGPLTAQEEKREVEQRLCYRLGAAALAAGFSDDWTDAQLGRAFAAAVKAHDAPKAMAPVAPPKVPEAPVPKASAPVAPVAKPSVAPVGVKP